MKAKTLTDLCKIVSGISNPSSLTPLYRSIEIGGESVRACSEFGNIQILTEPSGLPRPVLLDTAALLAIAGSLSRESEVELEDKGNKINWRCENAKGHLNLVQTDYSAPQLTHSNFPWKPPDTFGNAVLLAACACQAAAVSIGLYGVTIEPIEDKLYLMSSNSISLASSCIDKGDYPTGKITIRPPVPRIMASLLSSCPDCSVDITSEGIFIVGTWLSAHLPLGHELTHDLKAMADQYTSANKTTNIDSSAVKKFLTRAQKLTEKQHNFTVTIKIEDGKLALEHAGIASSTEEYFIADGLPKDVSYEPLPVPADMLLLPLEMVHKIVLDYLPEQKLVLRGTNPEFLYVVGGGI